MSDIELDPRLTELLEVGAAVERAVADKQWPEALELDRRRFEMLKSLPAQLFATADPAVTLILHDILQSVRDLEARAVEARDSCGHERHSLNQSRRAANHYESIRHV